MRTIKFFLQLVFIVSPALLSPLKADTYKLSVAGASPSGMWSLLGAGIDAAVREEYPGSTITYQTSGGGIANIAILQRNDANLALVHDAELLLAKNGGAPFRAPINEIRVLCYLYTWAPMQALVREEFAREHDINTLEDIARVKPPITIAINRRGNIASSIAEAMLDAINVDENDLRRWGGRLIYAASNEQMVLMQDRRTDMMLNSLFVRHSTIMQAGNSIDLRLLGMEETSIDQVTGATGTIAFTIPGSSYPWSFGDVRTVSLGAALAVRADMDEKTAYELTRALFNNYQKIAAVHPAMKALTPEVMSSLKVVPYHPGAIRYLEEAGLY